jgi:signal transduction histidine kinase
MLETSSAFHVHFDNAEPATHHSTPGVLARLTHELAQPLGAIDSIAYYLRMVLPKEDMRTQQHLERIEELVASVNAIMGDALHYVHEVPSNPQIIDLHELLTEALAERPSAAAPVFHFNRPETPALIRVDAGESRHLLRSLFNLFRGLSDRCVDVFIQTSTAAAQVTLEFTAPGLNASREEVEAMFEPFGKGNAEGCGLALASARRIVESSGGRISARSDNGRDLSLRGAFPVAG